MGEGRPQAQRRSVPRFGGRREEELSRGLFESGPGPQIYFAAARLLFAAEPCNSPAGLGRPAMGALAILSQHVKPRLRPIELHQGQQPLDGRRQTDAETRSSQSPSRTRARMFEGAPSQPKGRPARPICVSRFEHRARTGPFSRRPTIVRRSPASTAGRCAQGWPCRTTSKANPCDRLGNDLARRCRLRQSEVGEPRPARATGPCWRVRAGYRSQDSEAESEKMAWKPVAGCFWSPARAKFALEDGEPIMAARRHRRARAPPWLGEQQQARVVIHARRRERREASREMRLKMRDRSIAAIALGLSDFAPRATWLLRDSQRRLAIVERQTNLRTPACRREDWRGDEYGESAPSTSGLAPSAPTSSIGARPIRQATGEKKKGRDRTIELRQGATRRWCVDASAKEGEREIRERRARLRGPAASGRREAARPRTPHRRSMTRVSDCVVIIDGVLRRYERRRTGRFVTDAHQKDRTGA